MNTNDLNLNEALQKLKLTELPEAIERMSADPAFEAMPFEQRLFELLDVQVAMNRSRKIARLQRQAQLKFPNFYLEDINYELYPSLKIRQFEQLATGNWLTKGQNVLILGATGLGKSSLACVLAQLAISNEIPVLFYRLSKLLLELVAADEEKQLPKFIKKINRAALLIIDDWGNASMEDKERHLLFELVESRDVNGSVIITSQYPVEVWHQSFNNETIADSVLDRIIHNSHRIELVGESIRKLQGEKELNHVQ